MLPLRMLCDEPRYAGDAVRLTANAALTCAEGVRVEGSVMHDEMAKK